MCSCLFNMLCAQARTHEHTHTQTHVHAYISMSTCRVVTVQCLPLSIATLFLRQSLTKTRAHQFRQAEIRLKSPPVPTSSEL